MRTVLAGLMMATVATAAYAAPAPKAATPFKVAHNHLGQPEFEGTWSMNSMTRLERPATVPNLVLTPEQLKVPPAQILPSDAVGTHESDPTDSFQAGWAKLGNEYRSSWIVEPQDGRLPFSDNGKKMMAGRGGADNPEGRSNYERCLTTPLAGPPMVNSAYNNNIEFVQTKDAIAIRQESNHEVRIIHLNTKTHGPNRQWFGDSIGWFEGDTLVVETTGFTPSQNERRASTTRLYMSPDAKVTERFTRISASQIKYEYVVEDPQVFTQTWKAEVPLTLTTEPTFEYACHEGNYGLTNILAGARYEEEQKKTREAAR